MLKHVLTALLLCTATYTVTTLAIEEQSSRNAQSPDAQTNPQTGPTKQPSTELTNISHSGRLLLKKLKVNESTNVNGFLEVVDSKLNKATTVNGHVEAKESQFNELTVNGDTQLKGVAILGVAKINGKLSVEHTRFDNTLDVHGLLKAKDSAFKKPITIASTQTDMENCTLEAITFKKPAKDESQYLVLKNTTIDGNVDFESGKGIVQMDGQSAIKGKVTGGTIKK